VFDRVKKRERKISKLFYFVEWGKRNVLKLEFTVLCILFKKNKMLVGIFPLSFLFQFREHFSTSDNKVGSKEESSSAFLISA